ncbi:NO-inducible flavohemoprotein [Chryseobacterium sp. L7]|uniref:nitric oxide dioxygenase n=1 Tax=Chryseobacterium endalhagicum TaxID=2797638 RepID=A0ABS1QB88_9FLAO|nr:NO-inducible flavohemoprotein [Chryseobacterium endalhagicum]MBL1219878.1 NO-inducible flavohemoprotein [Chryseobacterium endalhagicum]
MNSNQKKLVKSTVPVLQTNGTDLTKHFYSRMFKHHPELKNLFNMSNQASGKQQHALAGAVLAYAEHIENPEVLINVLKSIGNKHVSLNISPEQYDIVGHHLISSIKEVLGEAASDDLIEAWTEAYNELAQIMISIEAELYQSNLKKEGGWKGWRTFIISEITEESSEVKSFYLKPKDQASIADYLPGQYLSVKLFIPALGHEQARQYSLSSAFNPEYYRISVKKESNGNVPEGVVSNMLHHKKTGDEIWVSAPSGVFHAGVESNQPLVLISGGIGITPLLSMLETNKKRLQENTTVWLHSCRNEKVHAFKDNVDRLNQDSEWLTTHVFYETLSQNGNDSVKEGRINLAELRDEVLIDDAKYYICGPEVFIKVQYDSLIKLGVAQEDILYEEFGPQLLHFN